MFDFSYCHLTTWKNGEHYNHAGATVVVSYDGANHAYAIPSDKKCAFMDWALCVFGGDETEDDEITFKFFSTGDANLDNAAAETL